MTNKKLKHHYVPTPPRRLWPAHPMPWKAARSQNEAVNATRHRQAAKNCRHVGSHAGGVETTGAIVASLPRKPAWPPPLEHTERK
jgi:hypothetical protein